MLLKLMLPNRPSTTQGLVNDDNTKGYTETGNSLCQSKIDFKSLFFYSSKCALRQYFFFLSTLFFFPFLSIRLKINCSVLTFYNFFLFKSWCMSVLYNSTFCVQLDNEEMSISFCITKQKNKQMRIMQVQNFLSRSEDLKRSELHRELY